ncbi:uncharacterized protein LOC135502331 [Lineus longissimus]|uniref:uncharacterized protein LOC135502331 n=1 Tax=Lineus longissimus TaxID=88925 RepID=UPI00315C7F2A
MKLLPLLAFSLIQFQDTLGMTIMNKLNNSRPQLGETITLSCNIADGTARTVTWWKDKYQGPRAVYLTYNCTVVSEKYKPRLKNVQCDRINYNFRLNNVQISDYGNWGCEADGRVATTRLRLNILVPPLTPTVTNPSPVNAGDTAKFTCNAENVDVTKPVTYTWTKNGKILSPGTFEPGALLITPVTVGHAGKYACVAKNDAGSKSSTEQDFVVNCPPSAPSQLEVVNSTAVAVTLKWISEFNGGYEQRFYVQYKMSVENWDVAPEVPLGGISDPGLKKVAYHRVRDLESDVRYQFRVRSKSSHLWTHTSNFSNIASRRTPEKPKMSLIVVSRTYNKVTVRWKQVTGKYTGLKIRYCQSDTEHCGDYTVPNPENNNAAFFVDANKTYYYYMIVEDGGDVVYRSTDFKNEIDDKSNAQAVVSKTNTGFALVGGLVGGSVIVATLVVTVAVVLWKRGLVRWGQSHRPANDTLVYDDTRIVRNQQPLNDTVDYDDTRVELTKAGKASVRTYENTEQPTVMGHHVQIHGILGNEPAHSDDDIDAYDYVDSHHTRQKGASSENPDNQTEYAPAFDQLRQNLSSGEKRRQERQGTEDTYNNLIIPVQEQPGQSIVESGASQTNGAHKRTPSRLNDDMTDNQESLYAHLGPVAPFKHGEYLNLRQPSQE